MPSDWVPLHVHSQYSILDATASVKDLAAKAKEFGFSSTALTDHGNLHGAVDFFKACRSSAVKAIIGIDVYVAPGARTELKRAPGMPSGFSLVLLAKNEEGYHNLCRLSSKGFLEGFYYYPRIDHELLEECSSGLVCLSSGLNGQLARYVLDDSKEDLQRHLDWYQRVFGEDYYIELQRHEMTDAQMHDDGMHLETWLEQKYQAYIDKQKQLNERLIEIGSERGIPLVATNDSHYLCRDDWRAHEIFLNVQSGEPCEIWERDAQGNPKFRVPNPKRSTYPTHTLHFCSAEEMQERFHDLPEALSNSLVIAEKCNLELDFNTKHYPIYHPPKEECTSDQHAKNIEHYLRKLCDEGIPKRYTEARLAKVKEKYPDREPMEVVRSRLEYEMEIITSKELGDYLLIVWDFIHWAKENGIPMGPGRGSGAGSIILYLIGITDIEPLRFNLFFERFINPERMSYPDIDVDICMDRRQDVIDYTVDKYGIDNVAQIITFGTMKAKMAVKDVGRVLSVPLSKVNAIAKLIPDDLGMTLEKALETDAELASMVESDEDAGAIMTYARELEGSIRNTGIHAAGVIIAADPLTNFIPVCRAKDSELAATQYSMKPVEAVGMLKVDFLGLKTLTSIQVCVDALKRQQGVTVDWMNLPLDDGPTFDLLNQGQTLGIFQMESGGMQDLARGLHLDRFEEIIAVLSLYRPGPMDMIPSFIARKHGREPIEYDHPWMEDILSETYGIMVYQEQVMQIASRLANFSMGEGDVLRRAMGKKDAEQMAQMREKFRAGASENGIEEELSMRVFDLMEKFAAYGFNKSHAAAYGFITYVTAFLKANYPREWMAALMTCDRDDATKVAKFIGEARSMGIAILPPDVNEAGAEFTATDQGVRFAMTAIRGVGLGVIESVVDERQKNGPYESLYDFIQRMDTKRVGKKVTEALIDAGCFDFTQWSRDALQSSVGPMYETAVREQKDRAVGAMSLFSLLPEEDSPFASPPSVESPRSATDLLFREKELLGFFLTGHPMAAYQKVIHRLSCVPLNQLADLDSDSVFRAAFLLDEVNIRIASRTQRKFAIVKISDGLISHEMAIWSDVFEEKAELIEENQLIYAVLHMERREGSLKLTCRWMDDLTKANEQMMLACDEAYDREKMKAQRFAMAKKAGKDKKPKEKKEKVVKEVKKVTKWILSIDSSQARLSQILDLKKKFRERPGNTAIVLEFLGGNRGKSLVHVDPTYSVDAGAELKKELENLSMIGSIKEAN